jgi:antitoxin ParD1/3/4
MPLPSWLAIIANPASVEEGTCIMPTRNVNLTEHFNRFIERRVASGRFGNASEVVREGLRLLEQREQENRAKLDWLRAAAKQGFGDIEHADYVTLQSGKDINDFIDQLAEEASAGVATEQKLA